MKKALLYKEWKKTKWVSVGILIIGLLLLGYIFIKLGRSFRFAGMEHLWDVITNRNQFLLGNLKYYPLFAGIAIGIAQFVPEIIKKRIKLTLHLPLSERTIISLMLGYGFTVLAVIFLVQLLSTYIFTRIYFPAEIIQSFLFTVIPWYLAGLSAYLFIAMICLEPTWKRRIFNILLIYCTLNLFFISDFPEAYKPVILGLIIIPIYILPFTFLSVYRFKTGEQD